LEEKKFEASSAAMAWYFVCDNVVMQIIFNTRKSESKGIVMEKKWEGK
jgi:hypothetical protein